jgi:hypothetical protein
VILPVKLAKRLKALHAETDAIEALFSGELREWRDFRWQACRGCREDFIAQTTLRQFCCSDACRVRARDWCRTQRRRMERAALAQARRTAAKEQA